MPSRAQTRRPRGLALGTTLMLLAVIGVLAFTVAASSLTHLGVSTSRENGALAQSVAESTVALATRKLMALDSYGEKRNTVDSLQLQLNDGVGRLTFNQKEAAAWGVDMSTNNLNNTGSVFGFDPVRPVPGSSVQLVAVGTVHGVSRRVETVLYVPPFPYAIASAGTFTSSGSLTVGALNASASMQDINLMNTLDLLPASLAANSSVADSLVLGANSRVVGDLQSAGGIKVATSTTVGGAVKAYAEPVKVPKMNVTSFDPEVLAKPGLQIMRSGSVVSPTYTGFVKVKGDLTVTGGMQLGNASLYVDGNLDVRGGIQGSGALFVTKNINLSGPTQMRTDSTVAVMSAGNVTIAGGGSSTSFFEGMLYNEGDFVASGVTLMGVFIQNNPAGKVDISNSQMIQVADMANLQIPIANTPTAPTDLSKARLTFNDHGEAFDNKKGGNKGGITFDAYPVSNPVGGYELADPNSNVIGRYASLADMETALLQIWNESAKEGKGHGTGKGQVGLLGLDDKGTLKTYDVHRIRDGKEADRFFEGIESQLRAMTPQPTHSSPMMPVPAPIETFDARPSRFLSLQSSIRVLYWRAR